MQHNNKNHPRWLYLLVGVISMLFSGIIYAWSILKTPLAAEFGWSASQLALNFTLTMCFFCIGGLVSGVLTKRTSPRITVIVSSALLFPAFLLLSRMSGENIMELYIFYGVMCGLGIGMAYNAIISATNAWFPDKKGMCSGALMMGFGASALVLGNLAGNLIKTETVGWRNTYLILGISLGVILLITGLIVKFPPTGTILPLSGNRQAAKEKEKVNLRDYTTMEMLRRLTFWKFFIFSLTMCAVGNTVISFAKDLALSIGASDTLAITLVGVLSICNGLGRIISGVLFDIQGRQRTMLFANIMTISAPVVILIAVLTGSLAAGVVGLCLTGISYGCTPTIVSAFTGAFYGSRNFSMNFSTANTSLIPASFTATLAGSLLTLTGSYILPLVILIGFSIISLLMNISIKHP